MARTSGREVISTRQEKLAELARIEPKLELTTLAHHIDETWLREAYRRTRKDGAAGVDGVTAAQYEADLEANLASLLERFKSGRYRAPAVRRVHIPKPGKAGKTRPIGIPTLEDKVLQRAVLMVLEPIYEQDFLDCSYGFRPGRSAHQALDALWQGLMQMGGGWIIDLDIQSFFDDVDWGHLRNFLSQRVRDGVIQRATGKWLRAGVMESGTVQHPDRGTPQGGVVSPLLSNVYMRRFLLGWKRLGYARRHGAEVVTYADDFVVCGKAPAEVVRADVERMMETLRLPVNATTTRCLRSPEEPVEFLGYRIGRNFSPNGGRAYIGTRPGRASVRSICRKISELTGRRYGPLEPALVVVSRSQ